MNKLIFFSLITLSIFGVHNIQHANSVFSIQQSKPLVITANPSNITSSSVVLGGTPQVSKRLPTEVGVCWSTKAGLESITGIHQAMDIPNGSLELFTGTVNNLSPNTVYYTKAYVKYGSEVALGKEISFKTLEK